MNAYEAKKQLRRAARLSKELSERLSERMHSSARNMAEFIPFGQPILVGDHSERGQETSEQEINVEENRLQMFFDGKPSEEKRKQLKSYGFRWSPSNGCWQAFLNNRADYLIQSITGKAV